MTVGDLGSATVNQNAGKVAVSDTLSIGKSAGGKGAYNLGGDSQLAAKSINVGESGAGKVVQASTSSVAADAVSIGKNAGGSGVYDLQGGGFKAERLDVGVHGTGQFNQSGGSAEAHGVRLEFS